VGFQVSLTLEGVSGFLYCSGVSGFLHCSGVSGFLNCIMEFWVSFPVVGCQVSCLAKGFQVFFPVVGCQVFFAVERF